MTKRYLGDYIFSFALFFFLLKHLLLFKGHGHGGPVLLLGGGRVSNYHRHLWHHWQYCGQCHFVKVNFFEGSVGLLLRLFVVLGRKEMRNAFNLLLVTMACFDSTYLFGSILESFRKQFNLASKLHIILFPYLLYPFNQVTLPFNLFISTL